MAQISSEGDCAQTVDKHISSLPRGFPPSRINGSFRQLRRTLSHTYILPHRALTSQLKNFVKIDKYSYKLTIFLSSILLKITQRAQKAKPCIIKGLAFKTTLFCCIYGDTLIITIGPESILANVGFKNGISNVNAAFACKA